MDELVFPEMKYYYLKNVPGLCESYVELEVLKNRSKGLHDKKLMFTAWTNDLRL